MRTVSFGMNISLDGYCDHTNFAPTPEVYDYFIEMMDDVDLLFYGRIMYELMFPYWVDVLTDPTSTPEELKFARKLTPIDRVVVSRSLESADSKTRIIRSNPAEELRKLKQQSGKKISIDTVSMLPELIAADLIDEFKLVVHPAIVGKGRPLFEAGSLQEKLNLKLVDTRMFESGAIALHYIKQ